MSAGAIRARARQVRATTVLALAMAAAAALLLHETRGQSLLFDEWSFFAQYRGHSPSLLLGPFAGQLELIPVVLYKALFATVGPDSVLFRVLLIALNLICAGLFFGLARKRVGDWVALGPTMLLVLLGAAWDVVAATLGITPLLAIAFGLGALLALERGDRRGDAAACALLLGALASNGLGLPFVAAAAVDVLFVSDRGRRQRLWIFVPALVLYGAWRIWAGHLHELDVLRLHQTDVTLQSLGTLPTSIADSLASALATITGLFRAPGSTGIAFTPILGRPLALILAALAVLRLRTAPPVHRRIWVFVAAALTYWALIGLVGSDRVPEVSRYQYPGALLLALVLAELATGIRISARGAAALGGVLAMALLVNLVNLHYGAIFLRVNGAQNRAELAAIEISRATVDRGLLIEPIARRPATEVDAVIPAGEYLSAAGDLGSPAYTIDELAASPEYAREPADQELARALPISQTVTPSPPAARLAGAPAIEALSGGTGSTARGCASIRPSPGSTATLAVRVPQGGLALRTGPAPAAVGLSRFADRFTVELPAVPRDSGAVIRIPADAAGQPWHALIRSAGRVAACGGR